MMTTEEWNDKPRDTHDEARALSAAVYAEMSAQHPREPADALATIRHLRAEVQSLRKAIHEATEPDAIFAAMDNVRDMDTTLDDFAKAASQAIRAALNPEADLAAKMGVAE